MEHCTSCNSPALAEYEGLWRDVADFEPPPPDAPLPDLTETAAVDALVTAMVQIDRNFDSLKKSLSLESSTASPPSPQALRREATLVREGFREALRSAGTKRTSSFVNGWNTQKS